MNGTQKLSLWVIAVIWSIWVVASEEWLAPTMIAAVFAFLVHQSLASVKEAAAWAISVTRGAIDLLLIVVIFSLTVWLSALISREQASTTEIRRLRTKVYLMQDHIISADMSELVEEAKQHARQHKTLAEFIDSVDV
ncbi:MAG: hypothetical protein HYZ89_06455 [Candidatus Omnitrophica bacterium]|nr:hypothetical protein [Candidatus Omnitrophota bacterium]